MPKTTVPGPLDGAEFRGKTESFTALPGGRRSQVRRRHPRRQGRRRRMFAPTASPRSRKSQEGEGGCP
jgi:hypothetical protein